MPDLSGQTLPQQLGNTGNPPPGMMRNATTGILEPLPGTIGSSPYQYGGGAGYNPVTNPQTVQQGSTAGQIAGAKATGLLSSLPASITGLMTGGGSSGTSGSTGSIAGLGGVAPVPAVSSTPAVSPYSSGSSSVSQTSGGGTSALPAAPQASPADMTASNAATFANAKNTVGQTARASLDALNGELGATGMMGGGAQVQGARDIVANGQNQLGTVANQNAITDAANTQATNLANLSAATTARGQDVTSQGQQIQQQEAANSLALQQEEAAAGQGLSSAQLGLSAQNQQFNQAMSTQQLLQNRLNALLNGLGV